MVGTGSARGKKMQLPLAAGGSAVLLLPCRRAAGYGLAVITGSALL